MTTGSSYISTPPSPPSPPNPPDSEGIITINHPRETEWPETCQGDQNEDPDSSRILLGHAWGGRRLAGFEENLDFLHLGWTRALKRLGKEGLLDMADLDFQAFYDGVSNNRNPRGP